MTPRGKILLTILIVAVVGFGIFRWKDVLAPSQQNTNVSIDPAKFKADQAAAAKQSPADVAGTLLAGAKQVSLIGESAIPPVTGASDYVWTNFKGKPLVNFPINIWPGWAPIITANNGLEPNDESIFFRKYGFYVRLAIVDDPVKARDLFASGQSHVLWGTLDMMALFAPGLAKDSRTSLVVCQQIDFSDGGDGIVARGDIKNINDLRPKDGKRRKVVLAQNSPSHYLVMALLLDANIDPGTIDFKWVADAPSAAKIFVLDESFDAFVGWSPDIYTVSDKVANTRLIVSTESANRLVADVWAVRNDFYRDHKDIVMNLMRGIFDGIDMVRKDPPRSAGLLSAAYGIPVEDCIMMLGKDGGIVNGDAHLTNYRENANFFLDPMNPSSFEIVWNRASAIYKSLGVIDPVPSARVKSSELLTAMAAEYKDSKDLSQPMFKPGAIYKSAEADDSEILTKAVIIKFPANAASLNLEYDPTIAATLDEIGKLAGAFGNAYIVIEGNTDGSKKGVVPADGVRQLSRDRAESVRRAIMEKYNFPEDKFKVIGNGWDNPLPGMTDNSNLDHNKANRRVEIKVHKLEGD